MTPPRRTRKILPAVGAGMAVLSLATACGGKDKATPPAPTSTIFGPPVSFTNEAISEGTAACGLLTRGEIEAAVSAAVDAGSGVRTEAGGSSCRWPLRSGPTDFVGVVLSRPGGSTENYERSLPRAEPVSGLGDRALASIDTVYVFKGPTVLIITVNSARPIEVRKQSAIKLAQSAAPRA